MRPGGPRNPLPGGERRVQTAPARFPRSPLPLLPRRRRSFKTWSFHRNFARPSSQPSRAPAAGFAESAAPRGLPAPHALRGVADPAASGSSAKPLGGCRTWGGAGAPGLRTPADPVPPPTPSGPRRVAAWRPPRGRRRVRPPALFAWLRRPGPGPRSGGRRPWRARLGTWPPALEFCFEARRGGGAAPRQGEISCSQDSACRVSVLPLT